MAEQTLIQRVIAKALSLKPVRAYLLYSESRGPMLADSVTYRTLFSVFAGVLLGFSVLAVWLAGNDEAMNSIVEAVNDVIPGLVANGTGALIDVSSIDSASTFTVTGIVSVLGLVGAAIGAIGSLRSAMRVIAGTSGDDLAFYWVILRNLGLALFIGGGLLASAAASFLGTAGLGIVLGWLQISTESPVATVLTWIITVGVVLLLDAAIIGVSFRVLSGQKPRPRTLIVGSLIGGLGLVVLQQLSSLFVGGASSNPLLATFGSFVALLLWLNLSSQVILIATAYIVTGIEEEHDRLRTVHGAATFAQRRVQRAEVGVQNAAEELRAAREGEEKERTGG